MDNIGAEVGQKMRSAIKAKLTELGCYVDDELPDYVMVMVANKRTKSQMNEDLQLFLTTKTSTFVDWLQIVLKKLKEITVTNPDMYKRGSKRKSDDAHLNVKVKKEKKDKEKSNKKAKRKDIKPVIKDIPEIKSLTDNLPVEASKLSEMRKIVVMQENQNSNSNIESVNEDCFDIPPLSEVAISNESELVEIEKKIKSVKSRLGLQVASDSDEDFINLKAEPDDLFPNEQVQELKQKKSEDNSARKIKILRHLDSVEASNEISTKEYGKHLQEPSSPKGKNEHPRIIFENESTSKKQSVMERLGKRPNLDSYDEEVSQRHKKINLVSIRQQEEELLGLSRQGKPTLLRNTTDEANTKKVAKTETKPDSPRESALKRLGVMSKVAVPPRRDSESEDETVNKEVLSVIKVKPRVLPPSNNQANKNLLLKAVAEAQRSVAQTPIVGNNAKPDALFTKKFREKVAQRSTSRKLSDKEKNRIKHILNQGDKKEKKDYGTSSDDDNLEYIPRPVKQVRRSSERLEYIPSSKEHSGDDYIDGPDGDPNGLPRQSKGQTFIITLDGIARQNNKSKSPKKNVQVDVKNTNKAIAEKNKERKLPSPIVFDKVERAPTPPKLKQIPDKLPVVISPPALKTKEKCKYWPGCRHGEKCEFVHPSAPCKTFPQCKFGDKCLYIHPMCKFENSCTRKDCPFSHSTTRIHATTPAAPQMCKFFPNCSNAHCLFYHPRLCKYGKYCKNQPGCNFSHAVKNNFTWRSTVKL